MDSCAAVRINLSLYAPFPGKRGPQTLIVQMSVLALRKQKGIGVPEAFKKFLADSEVYS